VTVLALRSAAPQASVTCDRPQRAARRGLRRRAGRLALAGILMCGVGGLLDIEGTNDAAAGPRASGAGGAGRRAGAPGVAADSALGEIQSVYAWMSPDATSVNLVMTVSPFDDGTVGFNPDFQYVFHVAPHRALDLAPEPIPPKQDGEEPKPSETDIICQFPKKNEIQCWVGSFYVHGNPSNTNGLTKGNDARVRIYAGRRSDPFFFNEAGFEAALALLRSHAPTGTTPQCPAISPADARAISTRLGTPLNNDRFVDTNVLALVISVEKRLLNLTSRAPLLSVWGSTHRR
jgi:Domain of unknown function (DUF4331)